MLAVYKRELKSYFHSMIGYVFVAFLTAFTGIYFMVYNLNGGYPYFSYTLSGVMFILVIAVPLLTMKCFAEEQKSKTDQLLFTAPVKLFKIVLGKYGAMVTVFLIPVLIFCLFPLIIKSQGTAYLTVDYCAVFVFFLLGCTYIAIGMFISALTESQIIAAIATAGILAVLYMWEGITGYFPTSAAGNLVGIAVIIIVLGFLIFRMTGNWFLGGAAGAVGIIACVAAYAVKSALFENALSSILDCFVLTKTYENILSNNVVDLGGIVMLLSISAVFVYMTTQVIEKRRWS